MSIVRFMSASQRASFLLVFLTAAIFGFAQAPPLEPNHPQKPAVPTVTFTFDWPSIQPHHYVVQADSTGDAAYSSWMAEPGAEQSLAAGEPYMQKFTVSAATRDRIFVLARQLDYFNGDFDYHKHRIAATGSKTLAYADPGKQYQTSYNWSENSGIEELTSLFTGISATIEAGRRLERLLRFDRLGLNDELSNLERLATNHSLAELQLISPILQQIADDNSVLNIARQRARHLLQLAPPAAGVQAAR